MQRLRACLYAPAHVAACVNLVATRASVASATRIAGRTTAPKRKQACRRFCGSWLISSIATCWQIAIDLVSSRWRRSIIGEIASRLLDRARALAGDERLRNWRRHRLHGRDARFIDLVVAGRRFSLCGGGTAFPAGSLPRVGGRWAAAASPESLDQEGPVGRYVCRPADVTHIRALILANAIRHAASSSDAMVEKRYAPGIRCLIKGGSSSRVKTG